LLDSLTSDTVVWDRKFTGLSAHNGQWLLHFENNVNATADVVIGANGGMSSARKYVTEAAIEYTGTIIIQGDVFEPEMACTEFYQLCNDNILMTAGEGNLLVANPRNGGILSYNVIFKTPEEWSDESGLNFENTDSIINFLSNRCAHWHECQADATIH